MDLNKIQEIGKSLHLDKPGFSILLGASLATGGVPTTDSRLFTAFAIPKPALKATSSVYKAMAKLAPSSLLLEMLGMPKSVKNVWATLLGKWKLMKDYYNLLAKLEEETHRNPQDLFFKPLSF